MVLVTFVFRAVPFSALVVAVAPRASPILVASTSTTPFAGFVHSVRYIVFCNWFNVLFSASCRTAAATTKWKTEKDDAEFFGPVKGATEKCRRTFAIHNSQCVCDILSSPIFASFFLVQTELFSVCVLRCSGASCPDWRC